MKDLKIRVVLAGAVVGFLETVGILWEPDELYQWFIIAAGVLNGALVALLIASLLPPGCRVMKALLVGGMDGGPGRTGRRGTRDLG